MYIFFQPLVFLILLLAAINYMNLATASSVSRVKEVGVKKVIGAMRRQLTMQYLWKLLLLP